MCWSEFSVIDYKTFAKIWDLDRISFFPPQDCNEILFGIILHHAPGGNLQEEKLLIHGGEAEAAFSNDCLGLNVVCMRPDTKVKITLKREGSD